MNELLYTHNNKNLKQKTKFQKYQLHTGKNCKKKSLNFFHSHSIGGILPLLRINLYNLKWFSLLFFIFHLI